MDRLVCGDVGFGKTEVAMRAAFIAASSGRQVVILVPTTLLADQHYESFRDRFARTPLVIECLSRFNSSKTEKDILNRIADGSADIIIGTHKLLGKNIKYKNLGLLIIDEEHRFGVSQKEKIKALRAEVDILTAKGRIPGVIGKKPIHLLKEAERNQAIELSDMWIDIGASSRAEAEKFVSIGDPVAARANFRMLNKNRFISKGTDDKIGAFVVAETIRNLSRRKLNVAVYGVGTVQEEVGLRGAHASAFGVDPDVGFAIDVGFATDIPDIPKKLLGDIKLGAGPELNRSCDNNPVLGEFIRKVAKAKKIPYQEAAAHRATGGTDTACIQLTRAGVATALLSIPNRYMHSMVEMCDLRDAEAAVKILTESIAAMTGKETFIPGE